MEWNPIKRHLRHQENEECLDEECMSDDFLESTCYLRFEEYCANQKEKEEKANLGNITTIIDDVGLSN